MSALPPDARMLKKHLFKIVGACAIVLVLIIGWIVYDRLFRVVEQDFAPGTEMAFKYASIGVEQAEGIPYWIWLVLPRVFPEHLPGPGGYASLGIVWEPEDNQEMPIGFSKKRIGYDRVAINCAICHTATYRHQRPDGRTTTTRTVASGPAIRFDPQRYLGFLRACANDPRFNADTIMDAIEYNVKLAPIDAALYRYILIPGTKKAIREQAESNAWMQSRPLWGPGRIDPFNPVKFGLLEMNPDGDTSVGNSDMMPLWELSKRQTIDGKWHLHWDGLVTEPLNCSLAGALGDGATAKTLPVDDIRKMVEFLEKRKAEKNPRAANQSPTEEYATKLSEGKALFNSHCASCHKQGEALTNTTIEHAATETLLWPKGGTPTISTDVNRLLMWNTVTLKNPNKPDDEAHPATIYNRFYDWNRPSFVGTTGYASVPLSGLWLRAPYLHNGSVPTLVDLLNEPMSDQELQTMMSIYSPLPAIEGGEPLDFEALRETFSTLPSGTEPPSAIGDRLRRLTVIVDKTLLYAREINRRPPMFYRGSDVVDPKLGGFQHDSQSVSAGRLPVPYLTSVRGNGNGGHLWGTSLKPDEKASLIEYLKTL